MKKRLILTVIMLGAFLSFLNATSYALEPERPNVSQVFDNEKEAQMEGLAKYSIFSAIEKIRASDFFYNEDELNKAVFVAFKDRKEEAISAAMKKLTIPSVRIVEGKRVLRGNDIFIAKKILQVFPEDALRSIAAVYDNSDAVTRGNIVQALGNMAAGPTIKEMLVKALDDKAFCEEEDPEMLGEPMRVCDAAYNQLVLRYQVKDVLRTIGPSHTLEQRDYHIAILKDIIKGY